MAKFNLVETQIADLPLNQTERARALRYVKQGEAIAGLVVLVARLFRSEPALSPAAHG